MVEVAHYLEDIHGAGEYRVEGFLGLFYRHVGEWQGRHVNDHIGPRAVERPAEKVLVQRIAGYERDVVVDVGQAGEEVYGLCPGVGRDVLLERIEDGHIEVDGEELAHHA